MATQIAHSFALFFTDQSPCDNSTAPDCKNNDPSKETIFRVPKFIQAIITLMVCAIIIATTLCIIKRIQQRCSKRPLSNQQAHDPEIATNNDDVEAGVSAQPLDKSDKDQHNHSQINKKRTSRFQRRTSGPFGDDAIEFVRESWHSYKKPGKLVRKDIAVEPPDEEQRPHSA